MSDKNQTILDWLQLKPVLSGIKSPIFGAFISVIGGLTLLSLVIFGFIALILFYGALIGYGPFADDETGAAVRNIGLVLVAMFGAPFLVWRSIVAQKQVDVAEQGHITDRLNKAIEGLGAEKVVKEIEEKPILEENQTVEEQKLVTNLTPKTDLDGNPLAVRDLVERIAPNLEVRLGAIYALERIAIDSPRDHLQVMEILCAYIRQNAAIPNFLSKARLDETFAPRVDLQAAITVIGRRSKSQLELEAKNKFRLDFSSTRLEFFDFRGGDFSAAIFHGCILTDARFNYTNLTATDFSEAKLNYAHFQAATLIGTVFDDIEISSTHDYSLNAANFPEGVKGVSVQNADISGLKSLRPEHIKGKMFGTINTKLSERMEEVREQAIVINNKLNGKSAHLGGETFVSELRKELDCNPFSEWYLDRGDIHTTTYKYIEFMRRSRLVGWPYP